MDKHIPVDQMDFTQEQARYMYKVLHELSKVESLHYLFEGVIHMVDAMQLASANASADTTVTDEKQVVTTVSHPEFKFAARNGDYRHAEGSVLMTACHEKIHGTYENNPDAMRDLPPCPECLEALGDTTPSMHPTEIEYVKAVAEYHVSNSDVLNSNNNRIATFHLQDSALVCANVLNRETTQLCSQLASAQAELEDLRKRYNDLTHNYAELLVGSDND